jgi:hypothetical protein
MVCQSVKLLWRKGLRDSTGSVNILLSLIADESGGQRNDPS